MSNNDWVQEGTPRDEEWTAEQDDYGVPVEPAEWDDYASEQSVPVPPAPSQPAPASEPAEQPEDRPTADEEAASAPEESAPITGDEPAEEPSRAEVDDEWEAPPPAEDEVAGADSSAADVADEWEAASVPAETAEEPTPSEPPAESQIVAEEATVEGDGSDAPAPGSDTTMDQPQDVAEEPAPADAPLPAEEQPDETPEPASFGWPVQPEAGADDGSWSGEAQPPVTEDEGEATRAMPVVVGAGAQGAAAPAAAAGAATLAGLYRADRSGEETRIIDGSQRQSLDDELAEEERLAHQLQAEKEARNQRLGMVQTSDANAVRDPRPPRRRGVGHFGSFGLFVLRLVTAAIIGVVGYQILSDIDATTEFLGRTLIPEPELVAWILGFGLAAMAVLLVIGLAVRVVGVLLAVVAGGSLAFIRWGQFSPFVDGMEGFLGDKDLLLFAVGIVFLSIGGGRWGIDGAFVKARENAREAKH